MDLKSITEEQKMQAIMSYALTVGVADEETCKTEVIPKLVQMAPTAQVATYGAESDIDKAYIAAVQLVGGAPVDPTVTAPTATTQPVNAVLKADLDSYQMMLAQRDPQAKIISANTKIDKILLLNPEPKTYIPQGTMGTIKPEVWKNAMDKYANSVQPDDAEIASTTNFNTLKAAAEAGTPVAVHIPELNTKTYGYIAQMGSATGTNSELQQKTREEFQAFVSLEANGYVVGAAGKPGVILKTITARPDKKHPGKMKPERSVLADTGKKEAIKAGNYDTIRQIKGDKKSLQNCKTELAFRVDTGKAKSNGDGNIIKAVRLTCQAEIFELETKDEYIDKFGSVGKGRGNVLDIAPSGKALTDVHKAQALAIAELKAHAAERYNDIDGLMDKLKAFDTPASTPASNVAI